MYSLTQLFTWLNLLLCICKQNTATWDQLFKHTCHTHDLRICMSSMDKPSWPQWWWALHLWCESISFSLSPPATQNYFSVNLSDMEWYHSWMELRLRLKTCHSLIRSFIPMHNVAYSAVDTRGSISGLDSETSLPQCWLFYSKDSIYGTRGQ